MTLRWGAFVPQGWKLEFAGMGAGEAWATATDIARRAEELGYDHLWVYDHVETVPRREPEHLFETWTMLSALAMITNRAGLGQLVTCASYRNPAMLAKQAACVDVFSGGRLIFGIGAGWYHEEYGAYGWPYLRDGQRLAYLDETLSAIRLLWTEPQATFIGKQVRVEGAFCDPKPLQKLPPIWVGGEGEKVTLRIAARHADATNWQVGLDSFIHKSEVLRGHCEDLGRDFDSITRTHGPDCRIFDSEADLRRWLKSPNGGSLWGRGDPEVYARANFVGTVEQVIDQVQGFADAGCREFVLWFRDYPSTESLERFITEVAPKISGG
jgi:F420-dependent oxidoreductase-like protein